MGGSRVAPLVKPAEFFQESGTSPPSPRRREGRLDRKTGSADEKPYSPGIADFGTLAARWKAEAERLRALEAHGQAAALEAAAEELEVAIAGWTFEPLTLKEAATESGYSQDHLGRLLREGTLPNAGEPYSPRIRRCDLPRKPGHRGRDVDGERETIALKEQIARAVVNSNRGDHDG